MMRVPEDDVVESTLREFLCRLHERRTLVVALPRKACAGCFPVHRAMWRCRTALKNSSR